MSVPSGRSLFHKCVCFDFAQHSFQIHRHRSHSLLAGPAALLPVYADQWKPLLTGVVPDADGVAQVRWRV
ncbi:hypothetical protein [Streptomyces sp. NPDC059957]|uniref:hypothetical protein n=1 Tax=unclassified Streptomyces TaxID=2593676 RepID=UPI0036556174